MKSSVLPGYVLVALVSKRTLAFSPARSALSVTGGRCEKLFAAKHPSLNLESDAEAQAFEFDKISQDALGNTDQVSVTPSIIASTAVLNAFLVVDPAQAATTTTFTLATAASPISSALAAYGHYFGLIAMVASLFVERFTIKPGMNEDEETRLLLADVTYGAAAVLVLWTGYLRVTQYEKGWEFYQHESLFWVKMSLFAILGASSLFNTAKIIQREFFGGAVDDVMSEKLAERMLKIVNGELLAMASIPLMATLMSRGIGYDESIPWQIGAGVTGFLFVGLGGKYLVEAFTWKEDV